MKKVFVMAAAAMMAAVFTGCASMEFTGTKDMNGCKLSPSGTTVGHITAGNDGLYFLWMPLFTGSTGKVGSLAVGEDTVNVHSVVNMVTKEAKKQGGTNTYDMVSTKSSFMLPIPFPFLFYFKSVQVSTSVVK